ncbi:hypothetical protein NL676_001888 [Syzygium grande]|nr:hypothetical protein NL676_001888 [Syzygium grande]
MPPPLPPRPRLASSQPRVRPSCGRLTASVASSLPPSSTLHRLVRTRRRRLANPRHLFFPVLPTTADRSPSTPRVINAHRSPHSSAPPAYRHRDRHCRPHHRQPASHHRRRSPSHCLTPLLSLPSSHLSPSPPLLACRCRRCAASTSLATAWPNTACPPPPVRAYCRPSHRLGHSPLAWPLPGRAACPLIT